MWPDEAEPSSGHTDGGYYSRTALGCDAQGFAHPQRYPTNPPQPLGKADGIVVPTYTNWH